LDLLFWRIYYAIKKNNYLKISTLLIVTCSLFAGILNLEGNNCITKINSLTNEPKTNKTGQMQQQQQQQQSTPIQQLYKNQSEKERKESFAIVQHCFLVTNLYVYSLYGIIIGIIIIVVWYIKYKRVWSRKIKKIDK
jgi:hypothetical protein